MADAELDRLLRQQQPWQNAMLPTATEGDAADETRVDERGKTLRFTDRQWIKKKKLSRSWTAEAVPDSKDNK